MQRSKKTGKAERQMFMIFCKAGTEYARAKAAQTLHDVKDAMHINYFDDADLLK